MPRSSRAWAACSRRRSCMPITFGMLTVGCAGLMLNYAFYRARLLPRVLHVGPGRVRGDPVRLGAGDHGLQSEFAAHAACWPVGALRRGVADCQGLQCIARFARTYPIAVERIESPPAARGPIHPNA